MTNRMAALEQILSQNPEDRLARFGLAMEYARMGELEKAVQQYRELVEHHPGYAYAYYHGGQALEQLGRAEEARDFYRRGIEAASQQGDAHAKSELEAALDLLG